MRRVYKQLMLIVCVLLASKAQALTLTTDIKDHQLHTQLIDIRYPARFIDKELNSGLPNTITYWATLNQGNERLSSLQTQWQITYDLWDEIYLLSIMRSDGYQQDIQIKTLQALKDKLNRLNIGPLLNTAELTNNQRYQIKAQVIVNPVKSERIKKIQNWLATSKGFTPNSETTKHSTSLMRDTVNTIDGEKTPLASGVRSSGPRFKKLFDQILEQYMDSDEIPALWRSQVVTLKFTKEQLSDENRTN